MHAAVQAGGAGIRCAAGSLARRVVRDAAWCGDVGMTLFDFGSRVVTVEPGPALSPDAPVLSFTVRGLPAPQGSKNAFRNRHTGRIQQVESSKKVAPWRSDVRDAALEAIGDGWQLLDGPLEVAMTFTFRRPKGHFRTGRNAHLLSSRATARPQGVPDLSKLVRSTEDALNEVVWVDDARVVGYRRLGKWWAGTAAPDVLADGGGCVVRVWVL